MIDNGHIPVAPTPQIGSLLVACCRTIANTTLEDIVQLVLTAHGPDKMERIT